MAMRWGWLWLGLVALVLVGGCIGTDDAGSTDEAIEVDDLQTEEAAADGAEAREENASASEDDCETVRDEVTGLLEKRRDDPFADRPPMEPRLETCGEAGTFLLVAHGLEGEQALELSWSFPQGTECEGAIGEAAVGGHHNYHVAGWDRPDGTSTVGAGSGGGGLIVGAFAGPVHTRDGDGATAWAGSIEEGFGEGEHRYRTATNGWGAWNTTLTEGGALFVALVCEGPFAFEG